VQALPLLATEAVKVVAVTLVLGLPPDDDVPGARVVVLALPLPPAPVVVLPPAPALDSPPPDEAGLLRVAAVVGLPPVRLVALVANGDPTQLMPNATVTGTALQRTRRSADRAVSRWVSVMCPTKDGTHSVARQPDSFWGVPFRRASCITTGLRG
jgi:hypothetical protein